MNHRIAAKPPPRLRVAATALTGSDHAQIVCHQIFFRAPAAAVLLDCLGQTRLFA
jgi:hypothetical protein